MKYIWIIIVAIMALIWSIASIINIIWAIREEGIFYGISECTEYYAQVWLTLVFLGVFLYSFSLWMST